MSRTRALVALASLLFLLDAGSARADTIEILPVTSSEAPSQTELVVTGCMDLLFEGGMIATNEAAAVILPAEWENRVRGILVARERLVDEVLSFYIVYKPAAAGSDLLLPVSIRYRMVATKNLALLAEGSLEAPPEGAETIKNLAAILRSLGASLAKVALKALSGKDSISAAVFAGPWAAPALAHIDVYKSLGVCI